MDTQKRATVYFEPDVHRALRLKATASDRSISDMVNDAVKAALAEDAKILRLSPIERRRGMESGSLPTASRFQVQTAKVEPRKRHGRAWLKQLNLSWRIGERMPCVVFLLTPSEKPLSSNETEHVAPASSEAQLLP